MTQTFEVARANMYAQLHPYTFGKLVRDCKVSRIDKTGAALSDPYFHGTVKSLGITQDDPRNALVWFKKGASPLRGFALGPVTITPPPTGHIPSIGDILMGKTVENEQGKGGVNLRYIQWYPNMNALFVLCGILRMGTSKSEAQLSHDLRLSYGECRDQVWALARLVLFGNVQVFVDLFNKKPASRPMQIGKVDVFISECSYAFEDDDIWKRFAELIPNIDRPAPMTSELSQVTQNTAAPSLSNAFHVSALKKTVDLYLGFGATAYESHTPPSTPPFPPSVRYSYNQLSQIGLQGPVSPVYQPRTPPSSPPPKFNKSSVYEPVSPVYQPVSPVYQPCTPPSSPPPKFNRSPVYEPSTPLSPYRSPMYEPCTPPYVQDVTVYDPVSPVSVVASPDTSHRARTAAQLSMALEVSSKLNTLKRKQL